MKRKGTIKQVILSISEKNKSGIRNKENKEISIFRITDKKLIGNFSMAIQIRKPNKTLEKQYKKQGNKCCYCDTNIPFLHITKDHFHPKDPKVGGSSFVNNKVFACRPCNTAKANLTIEEFRKSIIQRIIAVLRAVVAQDWKIYKKQDKELRYCSKVLKNLTRIIKNGGKPEILFT